jgi:hypothetical protein
LIACHAGVFGGASTRITSTFCASSARSAP